MFLGAAYAALGESGRRRVVIDAGDRDMALESPAAAPNSSDPLELPSPATMVPLAQDAPRRVRQGMAAR